MSTSTIELSITGVNAHSAPNIPPDMAHNSDTRTQLPPLAATSNHFSSSYSTPTTVINLPRYPLQAHINSYPPPQVVDTTLAPGSENVAVMPVCTQPQTGIQPNVLGQTLDTVDSAALPATISPVVNLGGGVSFQISDAGGALPLPVTAVVDTSEKSGIIALVQYALFLLVIGSIIAIRILA